MPVFKDALNCIRCGACLNVCPIFKNVGGFTYGTTYHGLMDRAALKAGETVLVLGAAGGVGTAAIQIAKAAGAKVIAAASTEKKCALCATLGADATINYSTHHLRDEVKALTEGKGPDVIYDPVGGDLAEFVLAVEEPGGVVGDGLKGL